MYRIFYPSYPFLGISRLWTFVREENDYIFKNFSLEDYNSVTVQLIRHSGISIDLLTFYWQIYSVVAEI